METKVRPDQVQASNLLQQANLARVRGQWAEATELCVTILRAEPGNADAHSLLGDIYRDQGATEDALQWYRMAVDIHPNASDEAKLRQMETLRAQRIASSAPRSSALAASQELDGSVSSGTTQLMGLSPKRWLNSITIVSAAFLAATLLVLLLMQGPQRNARPTARSLKLPPSPTMPTADTAPIYSAPDPNRPTVLPAGETLRRPKQVHQTGSGLAPDQPSASRTIPIPTPESPPRTRQYEVPPAAVQTVRPIGNLPDVAAPRSFQQSEQQTGRLALPPHRTMGVAGQVSEQEAPAPGVGAGEGTITPEEQERINHGH